MKESFMNEIRLTALLQEEDDRVQDDHGAHQQMDPITQKMKGSLDLVSKRDGSRTPDPGEIFFGALQASTRPAVLLLTVSAEADRELRRDFDIP
jgi:hypothetical protein